ncbi:MAG: outer membrane protein assembly factor BamA [Hyphomicrobiales bacterium]|nr:outer membrane protein assembly factor BamA [Hyphomicrobiales bacterium]
MKVTSRILSAVMAAALYAGLSVPVATVFGLAAVSVAQAAVVSNIEVRGNHRVDSATIRNYISARPGKPFSSSDIDAAVKRLFSTGLFSDVQINQVGGTLVIQVSEYSSVNQVIFVGNKKLKDDKLEQSVRLKAQGSFSNAILDGDVKRIKEAYAQIGRSDATVSPQIIDLGKGRVNVIFHINEGGRTKIETINFVGNKAFSDRRLSDVISTKRSNILSFLMRNDVYSEERLKVDEDALRRFYYNHGYADFRVVSSSADLNDANNEYTINITVDEGQRYRFGGITIDSTIQGVDAKSLNSLLKSRKGDIYSAKKVEDSLVAVTEHMAGLGYAFAQVTPRGDRDFENRTISVSYAVDEGPHTYIERIEIRGNTRTRDYVIRREFDIGEGDAFNQVLIQRAKKRLDDLDYFTSVNISTAPGSEPDRVILIVDVVEKSTGQFSIGAGYSTGESSSSGKGVSLQGSISERNFLGRGQYIRLSAGGGLDGSRDYAFSFTEPYFLGRRISAGFDVFRSTRRYDHYDSQSTGGTVRFGLPITDALSTQFAYNLVSEKYSYRDCGPSSTDPLNKHDCKLSNIIRDAIDNSPWLKSSVSGALIYNTIDDVKNPANGIYANFTTEYAGIGGDAKFVKFTARASYYQTLSDQLDLVGLISGGAGYMHSFGKDGVRIFDLFESNDRIIRGFEFNGIGPYDRNSGDHLGGTTYFNATAELQFPLPAVPPSLGFKGAIFADAATLYGNDLKNECLDTHNSPISGSSCTVGAGMKWRASAGVSLLWASPFGPLRLDYAIPVIKQDGDKVQSFNFGMSTQF